MAHVTRKCALRVRATTAWGQVMSRRLVAAVGRRTVVGRLSVLWRYSCGPGDRKTVWDGVSVLMAAQQVSRKFCLLVLGGAAFGAEVTPCVCAAVRVSEATVG